MSLMNRRQKTEALVLIYKWRDEGHPGLISQDLAFTLSKGLAGQEGNDTLMPLATVAVLTVKRAVR